VCSVFLVSKKDFFFSLYVCTVAVIMYVCDFKKLKEVTYYINMYVFKEIVVEFIA